MAGHLVSWRVVEGDIELQLPLDAQDIAITEHQEEDGSVWFEVQFWNPHAVYRALPDNLDLADLAARVGAREQVFPGGVNLEVVPELGVTDELRVRVHERGVGETAACGSGALAVAAVAWKLGGGARIGVTMSGGRLEIQRTSEGGITLRGAAKLGPQRSLQELL
jgi:diaminopimelate epimerase